ncbi:MAG: M56 family metallopeptidase [Chthoniobacteraceae bacterium]
MNSENLLYSLADLMLKGVAIMALAFAVSVLLRRSSAATQGVIWSFAFVALLLLPFTLLFPPQWSWMPTGQSVAHELSKGPRESMVLFAPQFSDEMALTERTLPLVRPDWKMAVVAVWSSGLVALLLRRAAGNFQIWRLARNCVAPPPRMVQLSRETASRSGLQSAALLHLSPFTEVPLTWGAWRPVITLPVESVDWSEDRLLVALRHEYAHIRSYDALTRLIAQFACAIHWMNPLAWLAAKKMRLLQEQAADDLVLVSGVDPLVYADELVQTVRQIHSSTNCTSALAMAQPCTLAVRVQAILDPTRRRKGGSRPIILVGATATALILTASGLAQVAPANSQQTTAPADPAPTVAEASAAPEKTANKWIQLSLMPIVSDFRIFEGFIRYNQEGYLPVEGSPSAPRISTKDHIFKTTIPDAPPQVIPPEDFAKSPVEIDAAETRFENGIAVGEGAVTLTFRSAVVTADLLHYYPTTRTVFAWGKVSVKAQNGAETSGEAVIIEYDLQSDEAKYVGPYRPIINGAGTPGLRATAPDQHLPEKQKARPLPVAPR